MYGIAVALSTCTPRACLKIGCRICYASDMAKATGVTVERRREITKIVRDQIVYALQADLDGGEAIMKEAWEACGDDGELAVADDALRAIIALITRGA